MKLVTIAVRHLIACMVGAVTPCVGTAQIALPGDMDPAGRVYTQITVRVGDLGSNSPTIPGLDIYVVSEDGHRVTHYYVNESVGIACGFLLAALNAAGLATLTHTPSPMGFLRDILGRPRNEKAFVLIPVGYPAEGCRVPDIGKKRLDEVMIEK